MRFEKLVSSIQHTHDGLQRAAVKAVNRSLTVRNWLIGLYIVEFEQHGLQVHAIGQTVSDQLENTDFQNDGIRQSLTDELVKPQRALQNLCKVGLHKCKMAATRTLPN